ncbi:hypothetical protein SLS59_008949 [Nothophoma quercina]|uniref:HMG box domain-containing protein n=1 Tax=Nothophoma quercina TaxID=749835 RepID=A0ABR3QPN0_9PLEO
MSPTPTSPANASPGLTSPVLASSPPLTPAPTPPVQTSPAHGSRTPTSPAAVDDVALKSTNAGVKKPAQKKTKKAGFKTSQKAKVALQKINDFFKAHRGDDEYKDLSHTERQKALGAAWKVSPENPKNGSQT